MSADMRPADIDLSEVPQQVSEFFSALVQRFDGVDMLDNEPHFIPQLVFRGWH